MILPPHSWEFKEQQPCCESISSVGLIKWFCPGSNYCHTSRKRLPRIITVPPAHSRKKHVLPSKTPPNVKMWASSLMSAWANEDPQEVASLPCHILDCRLSSRWALIRVAPVLTSCCFSMGSKHLQAFFSSLLAFLETHCHFWDFLPEKGGVATPDRRHIVEKVSNSPGITNSNWVFQQPDLWVGAGPPHILQFSGQKIQLHWFRSAQHFEWISIFPAGKFKNLKFSHSYLL